MKNFFIALFLGCSLMATAQCCQNGNSAKCAVAQSTGKTASQVEVIYFHGKQRCPTCVAIEQESRNVVEGELADLFVSGSVKMRVVDFSKEEGKELAKKYKVTFSSLFVVANPGENEQAENLTNLGFSKARSDAEGFRQELRSKITAMLGQ